MFIFPSLLGRKKRKNYLSREMKMDSSIYLWSGPKTITFLPGHKIVQRDVDTLQKIYSPENITMPTKWMVSRLEDQMNMKWQVNWWFLLETCNPDGGRLTQ